MKLKPSTFQETIENQFDYICKLAVEDERKNYFKYLSRISAREISFNEVEDYVLNHFSTVDQYETDWTFFDLDDTNVGVKGELLGKGLETLPEKKRKIILLHYFMDMSDTEIAEHLNLNRSTVFRRRKSGLEWMKKFMEENAE